MGVSRGIAATVIIGDIPVPPRFQSVPRAQVLAVMKSRVVSLALVAFLWLPGLAQGQLMGFLKHSTVAQFTEEDFKLQQKAVLDVLSSDQDRATQSWRNEKSGNSGTVELLARFTSADHRPCRRIRVESRAAERHDETNWSLCQTDGQWRVNSETPPKQ